MTSSLYQHIVTVLRMRFTRTHWKYDKQDYGLEVVSAGEDGKEMDLDQVPSLWRNKHVELNIAVPEELVKIHLIARGC